MRTITGDYFASFTAIFGPKECLLNGARYPLGSFAIEALELDRSILRKLEDALAEFKPELEVFLAARTASSAAVAQRKLDETWDILNQLPAYKNFSRYHSGSSGLFHAMREYPDRADEAVTSGTEFNRALTYWLNRLECLPQSMAAFIDNTVRPLVGIAPGETKRTCRQVGAHRKEQQKNERPIHKEYFKAYNRLKGRKNRGSISTDKWNQQVAMIQDWRDAAVRGEMSDAELKQKLDGV